MKTFIYTKGAIMLKKLGLLGLLMSALMFVGCGGSGDDTASVQQLKISEDNKEKVYSSFIASIDDFSSSVHLLTLMFSPDVCPCWDTDTPHYETNGSLEIEEIGDLKRFTMKDYRLQGDTWSNTYNGSFTVKCLDGDGQDGYREFIFDGGDAIFEDSSGSKTIIASGKLILNFITQQEKIYDMSAQRSISHGKYVSFKNLTFDQNMTTHKVTLKGHISSSFLDDKWFTVETKDLYDDNRDGGYFLFTGADDTNMKILFDGNYTKVYINNKLVNTFYEWDDFLDKYDNRNIYFNGATPYNLLADKDFYSCCM